MARRRSVELVQQARRLFCDVDGLGALTALAYTTELDVLHTVEGLR